jgi:long-chain acyl-CoA synthetase
LDGNLNRLNNLFARLFINIFLKRELKRNFGNRIKVFISGGAALNPEIGIFFNKIGLTLLQGYGQTEASPLISCNKRLSNNPKTVGPPVKGVDVKISKEGEILVKGENVMQGYWKNSSLTNKTIKKGWLLTGDLGEIDQQGRIIITGRKKDLIITSGGDNISVQKIENMIMCSNDINQVLIYGDNRPYLIALIFLNERGEKDLVKKLILETNRKLNSVEKIRKFLIFENELTYEEGFLTQTLKVKRKKVFDYFENQINKLY